MRPTSPELLSSIADALDQQVLPALADKWAASTARSASQLLRHLALRVETEPRLLRDEARELAAALTAVRSSCGADELADIRAHLDQALALPAADADDLAGLRSRLATLSVAAEKVLAARDRLRLATGYGRAHAQLVDCLLRQLDAERALIEPFQSLPPI
jgi:hypothetical protein